jgi:ribonuclease T2
MSAIRATLAAAAMSACGAALALDVSPEQAGFDYYVLALSWSPTFCASHAADRSECGQRRGFVVHGLWPKFAGGGGPEYCGGADQLDPETVRRAKAPMPDERLIHHEWVVHGTCSGLSARDYFTTLIRAVGRLSIPDQFDGEAPRSMPASQVVGAFVKSNPSLTGSSIAVRCRGAQLEEVRICLSRDLKPERCGRDVHGNCRAGALTIDVVHP